MLLSTLPSFGAAEDVTLLWPEGKIPDYQPRQSVPQLEWYGQEKVKGEGEQTTSKNSALPLQLQTSTNTPACLILISGGAYSCLSDWKWLDEQVAKPMMVRGVRCVRLVYRTPRPNGLPIYQSAWEDGQRAIRLVRAQAKARGFDPENIGALGFSAGGHLTTLLATSSQTPAYAPVDELDKSSCHLNWAVSMSTAYALTDGLTGENNRRGDVIDAKVDSIFRFDGKTCPMCFLHGGMDGYSPTAATRLYCELRKRHVPAEVHVYADRRHMFMGDGKTGGGYDFWFDRVTEFLRQMGFVGELGPERDVWKRFGTNDTARIDKELLWPEGKMPDVSTNQTYAPYVEWYVPKKLTTKAIQIIAPGGGYGIPATAYEGVPTAQYFNGKGMTAVLLRYRGPRPLNGLAKHTSAWQDARRAIRLVRKAAGGRGLDPNRIGLMGFSAGGHLTLMTATSARHNANLQVDETDWNVPARVQWACPIYPAYVLTDGMDGYNTTGGNDPSALIAPEFILDGETPPMCFVHGDADKWSAMNSVKMWERLRALGLQSDLHTLAKREHCFQFHASEGTGSYTYLDRVWEFLTHKGLNK